MLNIRALTTVCVAVLATASVAVAKKPPRPVSYSPPATVAADCSTDETAELQAFLNAVPNGAMITLGSGACYRVEDTLTLTNRTGLTINGQAATLRATTIGDGHRPNLLFQDGGNHTIRDLTLEGGYSNPGVIDYDRQWSHGVAVFGASNVTLDRLTIRNVSGDCIVAYLGSNANRASGLRVNAVTCTGTGRNGVAVIAADDTLVSGGSYSNIGYIVFDVEPDATPNNSVNGAVFDGATVGSYAITVGTIVGDNPVDNVTFSNLNVTAVRGARFQIGTVPPRRRTNVSYLNNRATFANTEAFSIQAIGVDRLTVTGNTLPTAGVLLTCSSVTALTFSGNTPSTRSGC